MRTPRQHPASVIRSKAAYPTIPAMGGLVLPLVLIAGFALLLAAVMLVSLHSTGHGPVPHSVLSSRQHLAADVAAQTRISIERNLDELDLVAASGAPAGASPDAYLSTISSEHSEWWGLAIVDTRSGALLAARGEPVPIPGVGTGHIQLPHLRLAAGSAGSTLIAAKQFPGPGDQSLVVSIRPRITAPLHEPAYPIDDAGRTVATLGGSAPSGLAEPVLRSAGLHARSAKAVVAGNPVDRHVVSYAPVALESAPSVRLHVALDRIVPAVSPSRVRTGLGTFAGLALGYVGLAAFAVLVSAFVSPVRRVQREAERLAEGDLSGPVRIPASSESRRIALALEAIRRELRHHATSARTRRRRRPRLSALIAWVACAAALIAGCAALPYAGSRSKPDRVPLQVIDDQRDRTALAADSMSRSINSVVRSVQLLAANVSSNTRGSQLDDLLKSGLRAQPGLRSIAALGLDGHVVARKGLKPRRAAGAPPVLLCVRETTSSGRVPVVVAYAPTASGDIVLAGEFDPRFFDRHLSQTGMGTLRIVDAARRVIGSNYGFTPFSTLSDPALAAAADRATAGQHTARKQRSSGRSALVSAAALPDHGRVGMLGWTVVSDLPVDQLGLTSYVVARRTLLVGMIGAVGVVLLFGWLFISGLRPLRRLAKQAEEIAWGKDRDTVSYPRSHNEVGSIARNLEILRLRLNGVRHGALTLPLTEADKKMPETALLPRFTALPPSQPRALTRGKDQNR